MRKVILIGGVLASGKSTYSQIIKEKYNLNVINKDRLKEILGDNIHVSTREENLKLSKASFDIMKYLLISNEDTIVLESNFKNSELVELKNLLYELDYKVLSLVFDAKDEILHERFLKRLNSNRHYVHKSQDFTNIIDFKKTLNELRSVSYFGHIINIRCDDFSYQNDEIVFHEIEEFISSKN